MSLPLVSIVIPVYNTGRYVIKTIDSILNQTYPKDYIEIIVIDDFSTDDSFHILKSYIKNKNANINLHQNSNNFGLNKTLNKGIKELTKGKYVILIGDDIMHPSRIEIQVKTMENSINNIGFCYTDMEVVDENDKVIEDSYFSKYYNKTVNEYHYSDKDLFKLLLKSNFIPAPSIMYNRYKIIELGGYDENLIFEDYDMNLKLLEKYDCIGINSTLVKYRMLPNSMSKNLNNDIRYLETYFNIYIKYLGGKYDEIILKKLNWIIERIYMFDSSHINFEKKDFIYKYGSNKWLKLSLKYNMPKLIFRILNKYF